MGWVSENWFWLLLVFGWAAFMLAAGDEVDRSLRARQPPADLDHLEDDLKFE